MADRQVQLYYSPVSYYSQMVLVALKEKEVKYKPLVVDIRCGEQIDAWYMRINSNGVVPTLQDGDKVIKESSTIIDYIDKEFPTDSKLVPDMSTELGKEVSKWRKILDEVKVYAVTFGIMCYPDLSASGLKIPKSMLKSKTEVLASNQLLGKRAERLADEHPDLRDVYSAKAAAFTKRSGVLSKESVTQALQDVEDILDKVEEQLKKVEADPSKELWFCGQQFTAADIHLCTLMARLHLLGLSERYHGATDKRPCLHAYWDQARRRPSVRRYIVHAAREQLKLQLMKGVKAALPLLGGVVIVGLAAGLAFAFAQKR